MPNFSIQTSKETLDSLVNMLEPRPTSRSWEDLAVSVTISAENDSVVTYYGIDALMSTLAMGEHDTTREASKHLRHYNHPQQTKEHTKVTEVAASAYRTILDKYWANIDRMDSKSLGGIVPDFKYVKHITSIGPGQELLDEVLLKIPNLDSPERFARFLLNVYISYMKNKEGIDLPPPLVCEIYPLMVHPSLPRTRERVNSWYAITGIPPMLDGKSVSTEEYAIIKNTELRNNF
ncbi:MAG: hypothetical protein IH934_03295 [Nanoarchaeota archaeon]|nr:hypothetical protein [Nanoarchaeota archaeon]